MPLIKKSRAYGCIWKLPYRDKIEIVIDRALESKQLRNQNRDIRWANTHIRCLLKSKYA